MRKFCAAVSTAVAATVMALSVTTGPVTAPEAGQSATRNIYCRIFPC